MSEASYVYILGGQFGEFLKNSQTVLPDRSFLIGQKLVENAIIKCDILSNFQTVWQVKISHFSRFSNTVQSTNCQELI